MAVGSCKIHDWVDTYMYMYMYTYIQYRIGFSHYYVYIYTSRIHVLISHYYI